MGRVEDVVVSDQHRGRQLGKLLVNTVTRLAVSTGCYKVEEYQAGGVINTCPQVTLNCNDRMVPFYTGLGYTAEQGNANYLCLRVQDREPREPQA